MYTLQRAIGNDYATDLINARKYYGEMLDSYAKVENPDDEYLLKLSETVGEIEILWQQYVDMLDARHQGCFW
tara:strand:- start:999 stop:1214 length:216 start_codon:yes stop_codon:yes gene_type:complete